MVFVNKQGYKEGKVYILRNKMDTSCISTSTLIEPTTAKQDTSAYVWSRCKIPLRHSRV